MNNLWTKKSSNVIYQQAAPIKIVFSFVNSNSLSPSEKC
jgi:hypothetical protein